MKKIAILCSGGDSQGMSITAVGAAKRCLSLGIEPYMISDGFYGLYHNQIKPFDIANCFVYSLSRDGGSFIGTSRFSKFLDPVIKKSAIANLIKLGIEGLIVIGGNGSFQGALSVHKLGFKCVAIPGTIDNDINSTDFTIGFDTTANVVLDAIDRVRNSVQSHARCAVIETMGRHCGDIAMYAGIAAQADIIVTVDNQLTEAEIIRRVQELKAADQRSVIVLVTENLFNTNNLANKIEQASGYVTRANVLGHMQRGGSPTVRDRFYGFMMGCEAVNLLYKRQSGLSLTIEGLDITTNLLNSKTKYKLKSRLHYFSLYNDTNSWMIKKKKR